MARVTVEDCLSKMENQFELATVAAKQARQLARGANTHLDWEDDKPTVLALREIAAGYVDRSVLDEPDLPPVIASSDTPPQPPGPTPEELEADELATGKPLDEAQTGTASQNNAAPPADS